VAPKRDNIYHYMFTDKKYTRIFILRFIGNYLVLLSVFLIVKTFYAPIKSEINYFIDNTLIKKKYYVANSTSTVATPPRDFKIPPKSQLASLFNIPQVESIVPVDSNFSVVIPKIAANAKVIANVNAADDKEYLEQLKYGVAHAAGTYLPGQNGNIFLFAHSTDYVWNVGNYNAVFYLLYKLEPKDEVDVFYQGRRYVYEVTGKKVVKANEVEYLTKQGQSEMLTLQTCWPPGTTIDRILVFARPKVQ